MGDLRLRIPAATLVRGSRGWIDSGSVVGIVGRSVCGRGHRPSGEHLRCILEDSGHILGELPGGFRSCLRHPLLLVPRWTRGSCAEVGGWPWHRQHHAEADLDTTWCPTSSVPSGLCDLLR